ncbi:MAG: folate-binding protein [Gammaproteobacteria bacterium]|nr:folate-binding protein [Gammaproteobacteria bacterium]MBU1625345.1 folate-binding protein [Gammaproteobacteria bacterium]MBU1981605.1 folate-binding protein [Gammaproteobacteria bacterium]
MNTDWQSFLANKHANLNEGVVHDFGDAAAERVATETGDILCDLSQFGLLQVSGVDAQTFLQNLLSNDIRDIDSGRVQLSSLNNAKGRMLASMLIWKQGDDYLLQIPRGLCEAIRKKLSMYVLRSKVKINDVSDEKVCIGLSGDNALSALQGLYADLPTDSMAVVQAADATLIRRDARRVQIITDVVRATDIWQSLSSKVTHAGSPCWDWLDIRAGVPFILPQTQEAFVPQMVNFELIGGINFKKGCYPGQEVVARMHYLGKAKRRMYLARVMIDAAPQPGDKVFSAADPAQHCGEVVNAAHAAHGGYEMLVVVQTEAADAFPVHLSALTGPRLEFETLPYELP